MFFSQTSIYMWFYLLINIGVLVGQIGMTYAKKYVGFWLAYTLPTIVFFLCPIILWLRRNRYARSPPEGSVLSSAIHIWGQGLKGTWSWNPIKTWKAWTSPDFLERAKPAAVIASNGGVPPSWLTYNDVFVDEVRRGGMPGLHVLSTVLDCIQSDQQQYVTPHDVFFYTWSLTILQQFCTDLTSQATTMTTNGVPNDIINNLDPFALIVFIPITAKWIYPLSERLGYRFMPIRKIFWGFMSGAAAMIWSAVVQLYIYRTSPCGHQANSCVDTKGNALPSLLSVWIQSGSYVLIAFSEIFASITGLEYAFTKAQEYAITCHGRLLLHDCHFECHM